MKILGVVIPNTTYKVFTALLRQSGGDNLDSKTDGLTTIGVTYLITDNEGDDGWDFTNVGAPSNDVGTYFIATGTTPANWYNGYLEYNTGAPVATVLENTLGNIWFTYNGVGIYAANSDGLFTNNKTFITHLSIPLDDQGQKLLSMFASVNQIQLLTIDGVTNSDDILYQPSAFEVRVYN